MNEVSIMAGHLVLLAITGCVDSAPDNVAEDQSAKMVAAGNPLLEEWDTPFGVPPFDRIESAHYLPAMRSEMARAQAEIEAMVENTNPPTFANTIEALEFSRSSINSIVSIFLAVNGAHSDDTTKETARVIAPELSAFADNIFLNAALFQKVRHVYDMGDSLDLSSEQRRLLNETHRQFILAGAALPEQSKARLREINAEIASLQQQFSENQLEETNDFEVLITDREALGGLPASLVSLAADEAKRRGHDCECWAFTLQRPSINPFLQFSPDRESRSLLFDGYALRGNNNNEFDNKETLAKLVSLRAEKAQMMGYKHHAELTLENRMAESTDQIYELLGQVWEPALAVARDERDARQAQMTAEGIAGELQGSDWRYYTEKVRKANFDFDEDQLRPYFEVNAVRDGVFELSNRLWGLTFERRKDIPGWHPDQQVFEVFDEDGSHLAILYMDFFARPSKRGGAWMNSLRKQSNVDGFVTPIVTNNFNYPAPTEDSPSLLSLGEASTLFHEFGHALHGMLSDVKYESLSGTATPRDFVEFPSQVMENWMAEPEVLKMFARHYETDEVIPDELIEKIGAATTFDQGFATVEYLAAAYLDLAYHVLEHPAQVDPAEFEKSAMADIDLIDEIIPRYRSTYFAHIFAGGYSAGYYSYIWSEILDADAYQAFKETELLSKETAAKFREHILSKGGTKPGMDLYRDFRGRDPSIDPLLRRKGFIH